MTQYTHTDSEHAGRGSQVDGCWFAVDGRSRGVSNLLGILLLAGIVLVAVSTIAAVSNDTLSEQTTEFNSETAENDLVKFSSAVSAVAQDGNQGTEVSFSRDTAEISDSVAVRNRGTITVEVGSPSSGWTVIEEVPVNTLEYEGSDVAVAYQSGGVWRAPTDAPSAAEVVRAPPLSVSQRGDISLTFPIYKLKGAGSFGQKVAVEVDSQDRLYDQVYVPDEEAVRITVESRYAAAWAEVFRTTVPEATRTIIYPESRGEVELTYGLGRSDLLFLHGAVHTMSLDDS